MNATVIKTISRIFRGEQISRSDAVQLLDVPLQDLLYGANSIREKFCGNRVSLCAVVNAKSGLCGEDCKFCSQAARHNTGVPAYPMRREAEITKLAEAAGKIGAHQFGIVTSGRGLKPAEVEMVCSAVRSIERLDSVTICASLGELDRERALKLREAGLTRYHHNLECSRRFFPSVCSTHSWDDRVRTVRMIKEMGLEACCGGIFGIGEAWGDRIDLAFSLRELGVDSVPLNFLVPIKGTQLESCEPISARDALKIISIFRYILPGCEIKVAGGREFVLGELQSWIFSAGASGMMVGDYLTTKGRRIEDDLRMLEQLGLGIASD